MYILVRDHWKVIWNQSFKSTTKKEIFILKNTISTTKKKEQERGRGGLESHDRRGRFNRRECRILKAGVSHKARCLVSWRTLIDALLQCILSVSHCLRLTIVRIVPVLLDAGERGVTEPVIIRRRRVISIGHIEHKRLSIHWLSRQVLLVQLILIKGFINILSTESWDIIII